MKTTRTILSIALVALTTTLFARIDEPNADCNCCPNEVELIMEQDQGLENWMVEPFDGGKLEVNMTLENWMMSPFEASLDTDVVMENWMVEPFEASIDKELSLEEWMTLPFESSIEEEQLRVESWMAASWI